MGKRMSRKFVLLTNLKRVSGHLESFNLDVENVDLRFLNESTDPEDIKRESSEYPFIPKSITCSLFGVKEEDYLSELITNTEGEENSKAILVALRPCYKDHLLIKTFFSPLVDHDPVYLLDTTNLSSHYLYRALKRAVQIQKGQESEYELMLSRAEYLEEILTENINHIFKKLLGYRSALSWLEMVFLMSIKEQVDAKKIAENSRKGKVTFCDPTPCSGFLLDPDEEVVRASRDAERSISKAVVFTPFQCKEMYVDEKSIQPPGAASYVEICRESMAAKGFSFEEINATLFGLYQQGIISWPWTEANHFYVPDDETFEAILYSVHAHSPGQAENALERLSQGKLNTSWAVSDKRIDEVFAVIPTPELVDTTRLTECEYFVYNYIVSRFLSSLLPKKKIPTNSILLESADYKIKLNIPVGTVDSPLTKIDSMEPIRVEFVEDADEGGDFTNIFSSLFPRDLHFEHDIFFSLHTKGCVTIDEKCEVHLSEYGEKVMENISHACKNIPSLADLLSFENLRGWLTHELSNKNDIFFQKRLTSLLEKPFAELKSLLFIDASCPICSNQINNCLNIYSCSSSNCTFKLPKFFRGTLIPPEAITELVSNGITAQKYSFISKKGKQYSCKVMLNERLDNYEPYFPTPEPVGKCPLCNEGIILERERSFGCNQYSKTGCEFIVGKGDDGPTPDDIKDLLAVGKTQRSISYTFNEKTRRYYLHMIGGKVSKRRS
jgi:hypothetical protein